MGTRSCSLERHHPYLDPLHCHLFLAPLNKSTAVAFLVGSPLLGSRTEVDAVEGGPREGWVLWVEEGGMQTEIIRGIGVRGRGLGTTQVVHWGNVVGTWIKPGLPKRL